MIRDVVPAGVPVKLLWNAFGVVHFDGEGLFACS